MGENSKTCKRIQELMFVALEDRLSSEERSLFDGHMRTCEHCQKVWVHYRFITRTLSQLPRERLNRFAEQRLLKRISESYQRSPQQGETVLYPWKYAFLGMGAAVFLFAFLVLSPSPSSPVSPRLYEARTNPRPEIFLRDAETGSWIRPFEIVGYWMRGVKRVQILPRLNPHHPRAEEEYRSRISELRSSLERILPGMEVEFLPPQAVTTPRAEPVEFWIVSTGEPSSK